MKGEAAYNNEQEKIAFERSQKDYGFSPSASQVLQQEKNILQKRLVEISNLEGKDKIKKQLLQEEVRRRRRRFKDLSYEKQLSNSAINMQFSQQTGPEGFVFKKQ